jgi:phage protein|nr:MAG TPA: AAA domain protein [Caudoviricetes sp.]
MGSREVLNVYEITSGKIAAAQKVVVYGPEGIGKSTFASKFPDPLFIDTEGSTRNMDVRRFPSPESWQALCEMARHIVQNPNLCKTLVIDTADWAEYLCSAHVIARTNRSDIKGIEDYGYGKGYVYLAEEFSRLLHILDDVIACGIHVCVNAHAMIRKFDQPDEIGSYDRWELKLGKKTAPLLKEWCDLLLFANYKTMVINVDNQGAAKGKNKAQGGKRVMYTAHTPAWDAKNRHGLPEELPFEYQQIAGLFSLDLSGSVPPKTSSISKSKEVTATEQKAPAAKAERTASPEQDAQTQAPELGKERPENIQPELWQLMEANAVSEKEIQFAVASKGYYPMQTRIQDYDPGFVAGVLIGAWPQVYQMILQSRPDMKAPF